MNRPLDDFAELHALLDALCEEVITAEQARRLEALILTHPEAEAYYVQYMSLHADLASHFGALPARTEQSLLDRVRCRPADRPATVRLRFPVRPRFLVAVAAVAATLLLAVLLWPRLATDPKKVATGPPAEELDSTVAVLLQAPGAVWEEPGPPLRAGAPLAPGLLRLKAGFAHIEFYGGATVILQGPAEFHLISRTEAYCASGRLRATVPPTATGFTIGSPQRDLVDRGTEFGLEVGAGGRTKVEVFHGKVDLYKPGAGRAGQPQQELTTGQGVHLDGPGGGQPVAVDSTAYLTAQDLARRSADAVRHRHRQWRATREALGRDPEVLTYYPFQAAEPWSRTLTDEARARLEPQDGTVIGCAWVTGRWPGKQGLEFKRVSDRVRFFVPGEFDAVTLAAWARVDGLPNPNNSLMMSDGWDDGGLHWQIGNDGTLILGVKSRGRPGFSYHAVEAITPDLFGQWLHLAVVYDRDAGQVTHYIDGQPVSQVPLQFDAPLRIGDAELGNWNIATHRNSHPGALPQRVHGRVRVVRPGAGRRRDRVAIRAG